MRIEITWSCGVWSAARYAAPLRSAISSLPGSSRTAQSSRAMEIPQDFATDWAKFPAELRSLVEAEAAAGNPVLEFGHGFPAPPAGAYVKLTGPVTTRPRASTAEISFYERNSSLYAGEFHDARRFYFVVEAPLPPPPQRATTATITPAAAAAHEPEGAVARFHASLSIDYEKWKEGIGYDLGALRAASPTERAEIASFLATRTIHDWRDVEALLALETPEAEARLRAAASGNDLAIALAVIRRAPQLVDEATRTRQIVRGLEDAAFFGGLSEALEEAEEHHPPAVLDALLRGALHRRGEGPVHFAALLFYLHGLAAEPFAWEHRPFFLRFATDDPAERWAAFTHLCARIGVDPQRYRDSS
jgi:hypothetical protein